MGIMTEVFDLEHAEIRDIRAENGEVILVPLKPGKLATLHVLTLCEDLARFMCNFTGRGYDVTRETMAGGDSRFVREPGHDAFGLKVFADGNQIIIGRVAILEDETIFQSYVRHLKSLIAEEVVKPKVRIELPEGFSFGEPESGKGKPEDVKDQ